MKKLHLKLMASQVAGYLTASLVSSVLRKKLKEKGIIE